jgi:hypothetical protein
MAPADLSRVRIVLLVVAIVAVVGLGVVGALDTFSLNPGGSGQAVTVTIFVSPNQTMLRQVVTVSGKVSGSSVSGHQVFLEVDGVVTSSQNLTQDGLYSFSATMATAGPRTIMVGFTASGSYTDKSNVYSQPVTVDVSP